MPQGGDGAVSLDVAVARYKRGRCPRCGKGLGDSKGLEYRSRHRDLYCHTCRVRWPVELDIRVLQDELSLSESTQAEILPFPVSDSSINQEDSNKFTVMGTLNGIFRRITMRGRC